MVIRRLGREAALATAAVAAVAGVAGCGGTSAGSGDDHEGAPGLAARARTVLVVDSARPTPRTPAVAARDCIASPTTCVNGTRGIVLAFSVAGERPDKPAAATVLTDTNCEADANGISHCLNALLFDGGARATVRHDHSMANDPCLAPGERVQVVPL